MRKSLETKNVVLSAVPYKESQFTSKDYKLLSKMATPDNGLRWKLHSAKYRDKRVQRTLSEEVSGVFYCPFNQLAKYINVNDSAVQDILKWRLQINK